MTPKYRYFSGKIPEKFRGNFWKFPNSQHYLRIRLRTTTTIWNLLTDCAQRALANRNLLSWLRNGCNGVDIEIRLFFVLWKSSAGGQCKIGTGDCKCMGGSKGVAVGSCLPLCPWPPPVSSQVNFGFA